ncbi:MAG: DUF1549 domain-containing protein, partial [Cyclobacteriaceae bacterium]|nr:DUF1549 domain-containing protein [Cyclobacteriaceae bacterium HetDA_MAG_MS6]
MNDQRLRLLIWVCSAFLILSGCTDPKPPLVAAAYEDLPEVIDFNLHVRPILSDRCFSCHGPDNNNRKANLRLDLSEAAFAPLHQGDGKAIVPGKLAKSMAYQRLISDNPEMKMPPTESNLLVTPKEVAIIAKWIEQGAKYKDHWAFIPPVKAEVPKIENLSVEGNEIDDFILSRLNQLDLQPSEMVDRETLIRRVSFDLTGLAPSLEEVKQFVEDQSNDAYEQLVDNLLASEEYAERMAMEWMDVARYADSHGMHADGWRLMWPWRDWVINAFNSNMPYDQFVIEQLAGDLIPNATRDQKLATAFHRNHAMTAEGGVVDEEFRLEYVFDRTNTTAKAFMGLTMECARCHDHKFDPISQKEYFQMTSFFNNVKELGMTGDDGNYGPLLMLPSEEQEKLLKGINEELTVKWEALQLTKKELAEQVVQIKRMVPTSKAPTIASTIISFEDIRLSRDKEGKPYKYIDSNKQTRVHGDPELIKGKKGKAVHLKDEHQFVDIEHIGFIDVTDPYSAGAWIKQDTITRKTQTILGTAGNKNQFWRGWEFFLDTANYVAIQLTHSPPNNYIQVKSKTPVVLGKWTHVAFTYDGTGKAQGISIFVDGTKVPCVVQFDNLYKNIRTVADTKETETNRPIRIGHSHRAFTGDNGIFMGAVDEVYIFKGRLTAPEIRWLYKKTGGKADQLPALSQDEQLDHFITRISTSYPLHQAAYLQVLKRKFDLVDEI